MYVYVPVLSVHAENLGASVGLVGMIVGSYGLPQLLLRIPLGIWSDRIGRRKPFTLAGFAAAWLGALGLAVTSDPVWFVVWRGMAGVGASAYVAFTVLYAGYFEPRELTRAMSRITFACGVGQMFATYAGGWAAQEWGWNAPFYVAAGLAALGLGVSALIEEKPVPVRRDMKAGEVFRTATVPLLLVASGVAMVGSWSQWATVNGFSLVHAAHVGATRSDLGTLTTLMLAAYSLGALFSGRLSDLVGLRGTIILGLAAQSAAALAVPFTDSVPLVALTQVVGGAARAISFTVLMGLSVRAVPVADRATAVGVYQSVYSLGIFGGPATTGLLGGLFGFNSVFLVATAATAIGIPVVAARIPRK